MFMAPSCGVLTINLLYVFISHKKKTILRILQIEKRAHNALINLISGCLPISLMLEKRCNKSTLKSATVTKIA